MICGFGSYKLELVRKWLEEEFEVVERDIDNLIKSQETEIERLKKGWKADKRFLRWPSNTFSFCFKRRFCIHVRPM